MCIHIQYIMCNICAYIVLYNVYVFILCCIYKESNIYIYVCILGASTLEELPYCYKF